MRTVTETKEVYKFEELSEAAQWCACRQYIDCFEPELDYIIEDAVRIAKMFGLDMKVTSYDTYRVEAAFEGQYAYAKGSLKAVRREAPQDQELHDIVSRLQVAQSSVRYAATATCSGSGYGGQDVRVNIEGFTSGSLRSKHMDIIDDIETALRDYAHWIAKRLRDDYEYLTSIEQIAEHFKANEYEFDIDGNIA